MRKSTISLVAALALSSTVVYAGYGSNAGYSTTKKVNIENQQWILVGYPGGGAVPTSGGSTNYVAAYSSVPSTTSSLNDGGIYHPSNWNDDFNASLGAALLDPNNVGYGLEDNATFKIEAKSGYWSQLLAHSNFSVTNVGEPGIYLPYTGNDNFMNVSAFDTIPPIATASSVMDIKLDGTNTGADPIVRITYSPKFENFSFTLSLDSNESNNTTYTMTFKNGGTVYILNDPTVSSARPYTYELMEFNATVGTGYGVIGVGNDANVSFGVSGIHGGLGSPSPISKDANYTVAKFDSTGQSWMVYEGNLTGGKINTNSLYDSSSNANKVEKAHAYWYRLNLGSPAINLSTSITVKDEDVGVTDISAILKDDSWNLLALPKGHIKHSQGGIIVPTAATGVIEFKGLSEDGVMGAIGMGTAVVTQAARNINAYIDTNGTLVNIPIRAYPASNGVLIISDDQLEFNLSSTITAPVYSIGGKKLGTNGKTVLGEPAVGIMLNSGFYDKKYVGTLTIEIPDLYSGFNGVEVNLTNVTDVSTMRDNIVTAMYNQACLHVDGDYNVTMFDADFDSTNDSLLIALRAKGDRNITADTINPTVCTNNGITRSGYNDKYLRIGVRENTYIKPYLARLDGNFSTVSVVDNAGNVYARASIATNTMGITITDSGFTFNGAGSLKDGNASHAHGTYVEYNLTGTPSYTVDTSEGNYTYFITNSRTVDLVESNVTDYNLTGKSKYSILSTKAKQDVLEDVTYLTSTQRKARTWASPDAGVTKYDVNATFLKGIVSYAYTLADLAQAPLVSAGSLNTGTSGIGGYSSTDNLNINTVWSVDMPKSGPLYDVVNAIGKAPARILTFRNGMYNELNLKSTSDTTKWFDSEDLFYVSAFNGFWVQTDSTMQDYTINTPTSQDTGEYVVQTHYDMVTNTSSNYVFKKWEVSNISSTNGLGVSMHNISVADSNMSAQFTSVSGGNERYEILIDPFTFSDFSESGFSGSKSVTITNGFESVSTDPITYSDITKPTTPTLTSIVNNIVTTSAVDGTMEIHLSYIDEVNLSFTRLASTTNASYTIKPTDINVSSRLINTTASTLAGSEINETKVRIFNVGSLSDGSRGLSSDILTTVYPLFNVALINPTTAGGDYNLSLATASDLNQTELIDADGDGSGIKETRVLYEMISDDGVDLSASSNPAKYDINGTKIVLANTALGNGFDGVQILSKQSGKKAVLSYRPNGLTTGVLGSGGVKLIDVYDGSTGVNKYIAQIGFKHDGNNYDFNKTKWYLYSEDTSKMYVGIFELNASGTSTQFMNCASGTAKCNILTTNATLSVN